MNYNLEGQLAMGGSIPIDPTLTLASAAAQAKATGEAINATNNRLASHKADTNNPHKVTKEQLGLGNVDNTADMDKPVSTAQAEAINALKNEVNGSLDTKVVKEDGKTLSTNDFTDAYKTKLDGIADGANKYVLEDGVVTKAKLSADVTAAALGGAVPSVAMTATLASGSWENNQQSVTVNVTASNHLVIAPAAASYVAYSENMVRCVAQETGRLTFQCEDVPESDLTVNILIVG